MSTREEALAEVVQQLDEIAEIIAQEKLENYTFNLKADLTRKNFEIDRLKSQVILLRSALEPVLPACAAELSGFGLNVNQLRRIEIAYRTTEPSP